MQVLWFISQHLFCCQYVEQRTRSESPFALCMGLGGIIPCLTKIAAEFAQ